MRGPRFNQQQALFGESVYRFVMTELELGITFAQRALISKQEETVQRNVGFAYQAYGVAAKFVRQNGDRLTPQMKSEIRARTAILHKHLDQLPAPPELEKRP